MVVEITEDRIAILDDMRKYKEVIGWSIDEWTENPEVVLSIANALRVYYSQGISRLKEILRGG